MRSILITFEIMMAVRLVYDIIVITVYNYMDTSLSNVLVIFVAVYNGVYVENRISIIILYRFLQQLKYAENTICEELTSVYQILLKN